MQDRADREENRAARLAAAKEEFREVASRDVGFALAVYRARLIGLGLLRQDVTSVINDVMPSNVVQFRRVA